MILPSDLTVAATWYNPRKKRFWALLIVASYTLIGFFLVPWVIKSQLPGLAQNFLARDAQVQQVSFNPWSLRLKANGFELRDNDSSKLAAFDELIVNLQVRSIFQFALIFHEVSVTEPEIHLVRYAFADTNVGRILNELEAKSASAEITQTDESATETGLRLIIDNLNIDSGRIQLSDKMPDTHFETVLEPITISISNLSTLPDSTGTQNINITTEHGATLKWTGNVELNPLNSAGTIEISGSPLPLLYRYFRDQLGFRVDDCCLDVALEYTLAATTDGGVAAHVSDLSVASREVEVRTLESDGNARILMLPELRIAGGDIRWPEQTVRIAELLVDKPEINIWLDNEGALNLSKLLLAQADSSPEAEAQTAEQGSPAAAEVINSEPDEQAADWDVSLASLRIIGLQLGFEDQTLPTPGQLAITAAEISVSEISNRPEALSPFTVAAQIGETGRLELEGSAGFLPNPMVDAKLLVTGLSIPDLQPWAQQVASISINKGSFGLEGSLRSSATEQLELLADIHIDELGISDTLENEALVGWNKLNLEQTRLQLDAGQLEISQISFDQPFARLIIAQDGTTNFQSLALDQPDADAQAAPEPTSDANSKDAAAFVFKVGKTTIENGSMDFSDFSLPLPFRAPISNFGGELSALASDSSQPSKLELEGQVGEYGLVKVGGAISVMAPTDQSTVEVDFRNINMPDLSPYTAQFAGRKIASGKLDLDLDYGFTNNKMVGENRIVLEKFELGEKVENPDAMSLPLDLAVGLLRDMNGVIDLQLNVAGDLDDPSFSASGIILKAFANLITKAVAAPFKLLGGLIPGGENVEFDAVDFPPGRADLAPPEREKLDQLAEALTLRPALQLQVPAGYNRDADRQALQVIAVDTQLNDLLGKDTTGEQEMLTSRTRKALEKLAQTQLPDFSGRELRKQFERESPAADGSSFDEVAYIAELHLRLEQAQIVDDAQLTALAETRRASIISQLASQGALEPKRVKTGSVTEAGVNDDAWIRLELSLEAVNEAQNPAKTDAL
jgi:hypothetical protein